MSLACTGIAPRAARALVVLAAAVLPGGCGIGYDRVYFATRTNVGLDIDSQPPTLEATIARREGVIEPTFDGGQTLPVMASFASSSTAAERFFGGVATTFAGGDAAVLMSKLYNDPDAALDTHAAAIASAHEEAAVKLASPVGPEGGFWSFDWEPHTADDLEPLVFGTDSALGLKVAASGTGGGTFFPNVVFGFRRKEFALAPVFQQDEEHDGVKTRKVHMPSLLATVDSDFAATAMAQGVDTTLTYVQYFATGRAASNLALRRAVREPMLRKILPDADDPAVATTVDANRARGEALAARFAAWQPADDVEADRKLRLLHDTAVDGGLWNESTDDVKTFLAETDRVKRRAQLAALIRKHAVDAALPSEDYARTLDGMLAVLPNA